MRKIVYGVLALILIASLLFFLPRTSGKKRGRAPYLTVYGPIKQTDGLGQQALGVVRALKGELSIACVPTRHCEGKMPKELLPYLRKSASRGSRVFLFEEALWYPQNPEWLERYIAKMPEEGLKVAYSMFETSKIPPEWVVILNCYFDAAAVPDPFLVDVYRSSGVQIPIFVVPLGINLERFLTEPLKASRSPGPTVFANMSSCTDRKDHLTLVQAFAQAFGNRDDVLLRINARESDPPVRERLQEEISKLGLDNVFFSELALDEEDYLRFFRAVDCYVSCSKGEGFSIQPREAMALGIPVIATNNTGQSTICASGLVRSVECSISEPARLHCFGKTPYGFYKSCTVDALAEALLAVHENYAFYLEQSVEARRWASQYCYPSVSKLYLSLIKPKRVILGEEDLVTEEYLMTRSEPLFKQYQRLVCKES